MPIMQDAIIGDLLYSYHPDTHPFGAALRAFKIVPDDFVT